MSRRIIRCSQCGEIGHNRRNINCVANQHRREISAARANEIAVATASYNRALGWLVQTSRMLRMTRADVCRNIRAFPLIEDAGAIDSPPMTDLVQVIYTTLVYINRVCNVLTDICEYTELDINTLVEALKVQTDILNGIIIEYIHTIQITIPVFRVPLHIVQIIHTPLVVSAVTFSGLFYSSINNTFMHIREYSAGVSLRSIAITQENVERLLTPFDIQIPSLGFYWSQPRVNPPRRCVLDLKALYIVNEPVQDDAEEASCPICFDTTIKGKLLHTNCSHSFCLDCLKNYTDSIKDRTCKPNCPYCRTELVGLKICDENIYRQFSSHIASM